MTFAAQSSIHSHSPQQNNMAVAAPGRAHSLEPISVSFAFRCEKTPQLREEQVYTAYRLQAISKGNQGSRNWSKGNWSRENREPWLTSLHSTACPACFLIQPRITCLWFAQPQRAGHSCIHQLLVKKMPHRLIHRPV